MGAVSSLFNQVEDLVDDTIASALDDVKGKRYLLPRGTQRKGHSKSLFERDFGGGQA